MREKKKQSKKTRIVKKKRIGGGRGCLFGLKENKAYIYINSWSNQGKTKQTNSNGPNLYPTKSM